MINAKLVHNYACDLKQIFNNAYPSTSADGWKYHKPNKKRKKK